MNSQISILDYDAVSPCNSSKNALKQLQRITTPQKHTHRNTERRTVWEQHNWDFIPDTLPYSTEARKNKFANHSFDHRIDNASKIMLQSFEQQKKSEKILKSDFVLHFDRSVNINSPYTWGFCFKVQVSKCARTWGVHNTTKQQRTCPSYISCCLAITYTGRRFKLQNKVTRNH